MNRDTQRKPAIYLLVILPVMFGGGVGLMVSLVRAYARATGLARSAVPNRVDFRAWAAIQ